MLFLLNANFLSGFVWLLVIREYGAVVCAASRGRASKEGDGKVNEKNPFVSAGEAPRESFLAV
jgi:hypothetical protein